MDVLALKRPRALLYVLVCGLSMAMGWAAWAVTGHEHGAMFPGALGALGVAVVSVDSRKRGRVVALSAAGALGMALAGAMAWGEPSFSSPPALYGVAALAARGAVGGGLAGAAIGMAMGRTAYRWHDLLWLPPVAAFWYFSGNIPTGDHLSPKDPATELGVLLGAALLWLRLYKQDGAAVVTACLLLAATAIGAPLSHWVAGPALVRLFAIDRELAVPLAWGFLAGAGLGVAAYVLDENLERPRGHCWNVLTWAGIVLVAGWIPCRSVLGWLAKAAWEQHTLRFYAPAAFAAGAVVLGAALMTLLDARPLRPHPRGLTTLLFIWLLAWAVTLHAAAAGGGAQTRAVCVLASIAVLLSGFAGFLWWRERAVTDAPIPEDA